MKPSPGQQLRETIAESMIQIPGATSALVALLAQEMGFHAVLLSTGGFGASLATRVDGDRLVKETWPIALRLAIPVVVDPGPLSPENAATVFPAFEAAGAAAVIIHDAPERQPLPIEAAGELFAAVATARRDASTILIARTVARRFGGLDEAIVRAAAYLAAGADWIEPAGLKNFQEFERFSEAINAPLVANMDEYQDSPLLTADELAGLGYAAALYPMSLLRVAMKAMEGALESLAESGSQHEFLEIMQNDKELARLLASGQRGSE